jgi:hypothetical protein
VELPNFLIFGYAIEDIEFGALNDSIDSTTQGIQRGDQSRLDSLN